MNQIIEKIDHIVNEEIGKSIEFNLHLIHYTQLKTGMLYNELKEYSSAIEFLRSSIKSPIFTIHISSLTQMAIAYEALQNVQASLQCYIILNQDISRYIYINRTIEPTERVDLYRIKTKTLLKMATIYLNHNDTDRALVYITNILDYEPNNTEAQSLYDTILSTPVVKNNVSNTNEVDSLFK